MRKSRSSDGYFGGCLHVRTFSCVAGVRRAGIAGRSIGIWQRFCICNPPLWLATLCVTLGHYETYCIVLAMRSDCDTQRNKLWAASLPSSLEFSGNLWANKGPGGRRLYRCRDIILPIERCSMTSHRSTRGIQMLIWVLGLAITLH